jgi:hypothetical protein
MAKAHITRVTCTQNCALHSIHDLPQNVEICKSASCVQLTTSRKLSYSTVAETKGSTSLIPKSQLDTTLSQFHPPPFLTTYFPKIHLNVIFSSHSQLSKWPLSKRLPHKNSVFLTSPLLATCPAHHNLPDFTTLTILGDLCNSQISSLCNILNCPITSFLLGPSILLTNYFSKNFKKPH